MTTCSCGHGLTGPAMPRRMKVLAIAHRKGGVGKTTTAVNLAAILAETQRVLLLDLDTQRNASLHLGVRLDVRESSPAYRVLAMAKSLVAEAVQTPFGFDLLAAHGDIEEAVDKMRRAIGGRGRMVVREALEEIPKDRWDVVIIDCPPNVGDITNAALIASNSVLVPMAMQPLPYEGLLDLMDLIDTVKKYDNPGLRVAGVFATLTDDSTTLYDVVKARVEQLFGEGMLPVRIRRNIALAEAAEAAKPVTHHKQDCNGAQDYRALAAHLRDTGVV